MFDLIQLKSWLNKKDFKEDMKSIDDLIQLRVYEDEHDISAENKFNFIKEVNMLKIISHLHSNIKELNKITNVDIDNWNNKSKGAKRSTRDYINDCKFISKTQVDSIIEKGLLNTKDIYYKRSEIVIKSLNNKMMKVTIDDNGILKTEEI